MLNKLGKRGKLNKLRHGDVRAALANLSWLGIERLTQVGVAIVISGVLARYFGAELFGKWQYANTLLTVASPITWVCGAEILVPTLVAAGAATTPDWPRIGRIMGSAFALRLAVALVALAAVWFALYVARIDAVVAAMLAGLATTLLFREPFAVVTAWLQARTYSKPALLLNVSTAIPKALAVYLFARAALAPAHFGWIWAVESAAIACGLLLYYRYRRPAGGRADARSRALDWHVDTGLLRHFFAAGSVFWLGLVCMYLFMKLDRLMLQHYVDFAELGRYAAAQQLNENWIMLALMLAQTVAPAFIYRVSDPARLRRNLTRLLILTGAVMTLGAVVLGLCAPLIVRIVFGPGFDATVAFFRWAAWLSLPAGLEAICNLVVLKYQAKYVVLAKWFAALVATWLANLLLIPALGGDGALLGLAIGYGVAIGVDIWFLRRVLV